jgi:hypothetical protein
MELVFGRVVEKDVGLFLSDCILMDKVRDSAIRVNSLIEWAAGPEQSWRERNPGTASPIHPLFRVFLMGTGIGSSSSR